jgi:hypothetical protein
LAATVVVCILLQLIVGAPYAANERAAAEWLRTARRGLIVGICLCFGLGPAFVLNESTLVRGGFHLLYLLSLPITLSAAVGAAYMPLDRDGSTPSFVSIALLTDGLSILACNLFLNAPLFATDEHKVMHLSLSLPFIGGVMSFFALIVGHVTLSQQYSSVLVGLLLPVGSIVYRVLALLATVRSCHVCYYQPKQSFLAQLPQSAHGRESVPPPLLGDIERVYGSCAAFFALMVGNTALVATLCSSMLAPDSTAWVLSLASSTLLEVLGRTGMMQRVELWIAGGLAARFRLQWPAQTTALKLLYLRSLRGTAYVAPTMALCIGCLRAATFGDPSMIVWLDVSPTVWRVLVVQFVLGLLADAIVWAVRKKGLQHFEMSARFAADHPLRNTASRDFELDGYAFVFGLGGVFIYGVFIAFLGPAFVTGLCRDFTPSASNMWTLRARDECTNATIMMRADWANGTLNGTLPAAARR